jgi:hypothetical protein
LSQNRGYYFPHSANLTWWIPYVPLWMDCLAYLIDVQSKEAIKDWSLSFMTWCAPKKIIYSSIDSRDAQGIIEKLGTLMQITPYTTVYFGGSRRLLCQPIIMKPVLLERKCVLSYISPNSRIYLGINKCPSFLRKI